MAVCAQPLAGQHTLVGLAAQSGAVTYRLGEAEEDAGGFLPRRADRRTNEGIEGRTEHDLKGLSRLVSRRSLGRPTRQGDWPMLGLAEPGYGSWCPDMIPALNPDGSVRLEDGETVLGVVQPRTMAVLYGADFGDKGWTRAWLEDSHPIWLTITTRRVIHQIAVPQGTNFDHLLVGGKRFGTIVGRSVRDHQERS